jgi:hypothetical protein
MILIKPSELRGPASIELAINQGKLLNRIMTVRETGIDIKIFHAWKMAGLLNTVVNERKWINLSFVEYLWLCTLESMRKFGCPLNHMKALHEYLFIRAYRDGLEKKTLQENAATLTSIAKQRPLNNEEFRLLEAINTVLNDPIRMSVPDSDITYFYQLVLKCFINNNEVGIIIYEDGKFDTYELATIENPTSKNIVDLSVPHILLPISSYIKKFIVHEEEETFLSKTGVLNESELEVIRQIRKSNIKKIIVTKNSKQGDIQDIKAEKSGMLSESDSKKIKEILGLKNYESVDLHTRDNNILSFTRIKKVN